jgi:U6 snRNA-associated Sm-like protein LSm2
LTGKEVIVELKNDLQIKGTLVSIDQFMNFKLDNIEVIDKDKYPHLVSVTNSFIRGSVVRYVHIPKKDVDTVLLQEAARQEQQKAKS